MSARQLRRHDLVGTLVVGLQVKANNKCEHPRMRVRVAAAGLVDPAETGNLQVGGTVSDSGPLSAAGQILYSPALVDRIGAGENASDLVGMSSTNMCLSTI